MPRYKARYFAELPGSEPGTIRRLKEGDEFDYDGKPALWMEPVDAAADVAPVVESKEPETFHELTKIVADRQEAEIDRISGLPAGTKRGPGRPPKSSYQSS